MVDLLRNPRYAVPLLCNVTGSVWFFVLVGNHGRFGCFSLNGRFAVFFPRCDKSLTQLVDFWRYRA